MPTTVKATIIWPQRSRQATTTTSGSPVEIAALTSASSAVITLAGASTSGGDITIFAARPTGPSATTPTYTSTDTANPGTYALNVKFYNKPLTSAGTIDSTAVVVATAQANTQILANGTLSATITTVGQIQSIVVTPGQILTLGAAPTRVGFTALGTPVNGQSVIIAVPDGAESVTASNVDSTLPPVASVANGLLTAAYPGQTTVTVTVDNISSAPTPITVISSAVVTISPNPATVAVGGRVTLTAAVTNAPTSAVVWSLGTDAATVASGATIDQTGVFTASNRSGGPFTVVATSVYDPTKSATATVNVTSNVVIYPADQSPGVTTETTAAIGANKTIALPVTVTGTTNMAVTYAVVGNTPTTTTNGSITSAGVYTAPNSEGTFTVTATSVADTSKVVTFTIPVIPSVTISPGKTTISVDQSVTFFANVVGGNGSGVTYSVVEAGGGTITSAGVYTAPDTAGTYHVKAASIENPALTDTATVVVQSGSGTIIIN